MYRTANARVKSRFFTDFYFTKPRRGVFIFSNAATPHELGDVSKTVIFLKGFYVFVETKGNARLSSVRIVCRPYSAIRGLDVNV